MPDNSVHYRGTSLKYVSLLRDLSSALCSLQNPFPHSASSMARSAKNHECSWETVDITDCWFLFKSQKKKSKDLIKTTQVVESHIHTPTQSSVTSGVTRWLSQSPPPPATCLHPPSWQRGGSGCECRPARWSLRQSAWWKAWLWWAATPGPRPPLPRPRPWCRGSHWLLSSSCCKCQRSPVNDSNGRALNLTLSKHPLPHSENMDRINI